MEKELNALVLARTDEVGRDFGAALGALESVRREVKRVRSDRPLMELAPDGSPDLIVVEVGPRFEDALADIREYRARRDPDAVIFATFRDGDLETVTRLMRAGVRDAFRQPLDRQDLTIAVSQVLSQRRAVEARALERHGAVTAFCNVRGGAGATYLAVNTAYMLAAERKRRVALIDLDLQFGTAAVQLNLDTDSGILAALRDPDRIDAVYLQALAVRHSSGIEVIGAPATIGSLDELRPAAVARLIRALGEKHDHVVLNLPNLVNPGVLQALRMSHPVYLVMQSTVPMLRNLRMMLRALAQHEIRGEQVEIVYNRANADHDAVGLDAIKHVAGELPVHVVRSDHELAARSENQGKAAAELEPRSRSVKDMRALIQRFDTTPDAAATVPAAAHKPKHRWFG